MYYIDKVTGELVYVPVPELPQDAVVALFFGFNGSNLTTNLTLS